jgi:hypothetical protein
MGERAYALVMLVENPKEPKEEILSKLAEILKQENVPYDKLDVTPLVPMDPRHHSKVEYDVLRAAVLKEEEDNNCACCEECSYTSEGLAEEEKPCCHGENSNDDQCEDSFKSFLKIGLIVLVAYFLIKMLFGGGKDDK